MKHVGKLKLLSLIFNTQIFEKLNNQFFLIDFERRTQKSFGIGMTYEIKRVFANVAPKALKDGFFCFLLGNHIEIGSKQYFPVYFFIQQQVFEQRKQFFIINHFSMFGS